MKKLNCPGCGANLKPDAYYCDYCGAFFEKQKNEAEEEQLKRYQEQSRQNTQIDEKEDLYKDDNFVSTEEIESSRLNSILISYNNIKESNPLIGILFVFLFFFIFTTGIFIEAPFLSIFIVIIVSSAINGQKEKKKELITLYQKGYYQKAYQKLTENALKQSDINTIKQKILLCYYRLDKKQVAEDLIKELHLKLHNKDEHIKDVAQKLGVIYEPKTILNA